MPIDASIPLQVRAPQFEDPSNALLKLLQIQGLQAEQQANALTAEGKRRDFDRTNKLYELLQSNPDAPTLRQNGFLKESMEMEKNAADATHKKAETEKAQADAKKTNFEAAHKQIDAIGQVAGWLQQNPSVENATLALQHLQTTGAITPETAQQYSAQFQANPTPEGIARIASMAYRSALDTKEQLPKFETRNLGGTTDTLSIDPVTGQARTVNSAQNTQSPDNAATNATSRANNAATVAEQARGHNLADGRAREGNEIQRQAARTQVVETDQGPVLVDKGAGSVRGLTGPNGQPLSKPLKDIPASVNSAIIQNNQSLNQIDRALALVGGTDVGTQKGDKSATGYKGYLPQGVLNRVDPKGVDARAEISDIGSLKLHDRSGAAVTISESPRLMPFIPQATDDAATVKKKLQRLKTEIQNERDAMDSTYSKGQGYKPSPVQPKGTGSVTVTNW